MEERLRRHQAMEERPLVDHTYRDYSRYLERGGEPIRHKKHDRNFPAKLHQMLSESRFSHIIQWQPHGRAFRILDKELLMSQVAPLYFALTRFESFTRQLSGWGFKRLHRHGPDYDCYYHECFLRGLPKITSLMTRDSPGSTPKPIPYPEGEPDFYRISREYPVPPNVPPNRPGGNPAASNVPAGRSAPQLLGTTAPSAATLDRMHSPLVRSKPTTAESAASPSVPNKSMPWNATQQPTLQASRTDLMAPSFSSTVPQPAFQALGAAPMYPFPQIPTMPANLFANASAGHVNMPTSNPHLELGTLPNEQNLPPLIPANAATSMSALNESIQQPAMPFEPSSQNSELHWSTVPSLWMHNYQEPSAAVNPSSAAAFDQAYAASSSMGTEHPTQAAPNASQPGQQRDEDEDPEFNADMLNLFKVLQKDM